ncbi:MAG: hypothetical protein Roseis2KO_46290 [Roseivirga sp.]
MYIFSFSILIALIHSCTVFENLEELKIEADDLLVNYPKTNYNNAFIYYQFTGETGDAVYEALRYEMVQEAYTFPDQPQLDLERDGDTRLLAALRMNIGTLIMPRQDAPFSEKELRALQLFVTFGGRIIASSADLEDPGIGINQLAETFGMEISPDYQSNNEFMYLEQDEVHTGHIMDVEEELLNSNFHDYDQLVMNFPRTIELEENHDSFKTESLVKKAGTNLTTIARATSFVQPQKERGTFTLISDYNLLEVHTDHINEQPEYQAYQGGLLTSGNFKFVMNLIMHATNAGPDIESPKLLLEFPANIPLNAQEVAVQGTIEDFGGIAQVVYKLNDNIEITVLDAFENQADRDEVYHELSGTDWIRIPVMMLQPGQNQVEVTVRDLARREYSQIYTPYYINESLPQGMMFSSTLPGSDQVDYEMGIELTVPFGAYNNIASSGGPLTESYRAGSLTEQECVQDPGVARFVPNTQLGSADKGAARVSEMNMPTTQEVLQQFGIPANNLTFGFDPLFLNQEGMVIVGTGERRAYLNPLDAQFYIMLEETPIIQTTMPDMYVTLNHNAYRHCADDIITFTSGFISIGNVAKALDLTEVQDAIAEGLLTDLENAQRMRMRGTIFNSIFHQGESEAVFTGGLRYQLGVHHPDPGAFNLQGFTALELFD